MCYFYHAFNNPETAIEVICHALKDPKFENPDFIVGTGMSGTLLLIPVSVQSGIPCGVIRKKYDMQSTLGNGGSHSGQRIEHSDYLRRVNNYVIIDDFTDTGDTISTVVEQMGKRYPSAKCAGVILYQGNPWHETPYPTSCLNEDIGEIDRLKRKSLVSV